MSRLVATLGPTVQAVRPKNATPFSGPFSGQHASGLVPPLGWVRFEAIHDDTFAVVVKLDADSPTQTAGAGGWAARQRPGRIDAVRFTSRPHMEIPVGVIFDAVEFNTTVEPAIDILKQLAGIGAPGAGVPVYMDSAGLIPYDWQHVPYKQWVIGDLQPERTNDIRNHAGHLVRASYTATLWEYTPVDEVQEHSLAVRRSPGKHVVKNARYKVKQGDTLVSIARRQLGSVDRWIDLAKLNGLHGGETLKPGTVIRLR